MPKGERRQLIVQTSCRRGRQPWLKLVFSVNLKELPGCAVRFIPSFAILQVDQVCALFHHWGCSIR